jgi:hypothetical protein
MLSLLALTLWLANAARPILLYGKAVLHFATILFI